MAAIREEPNVTETEPKDPLPLTLKHEEIPHTAMNEGVGSNHEAAVDEYPLDLRFFLLAGASTMAVFLISLDQVSASLGSQSRRSPIIT